MPATSEEKQFLHSLASYLAEDHVGFPDDGGVRRSQILDRGVFAQFWFNWRPVGASVGAIERLRQNQTAGLVRHHINDRDAWMIRLLSREWLGLGADGWFHEYEARNRTVIGLPREMTTLQQKGAIKWVELDDDALFRNHASGFQKGGKERRWAHADERLTSIRTGVDEFVVDA